MQKNDWPPLLAQALKRAGYRKHGVSIYIRDTYTFRQPYWDGGSKDSHWMIDLQGNHAGHLSVRNPTSWPAIPAEDTIDLPHGRIAVCGGVFCGKPASWQLTMAASTAAALGIKP